MPEFDSPDRILIGLNSARRFARAYHGGARAEYSHDARGAITETRYSRDGAMAAAAIGTANYDIAGRMTLMKMGQEDQYTGTGRRYDAQTGLYYYRALLLS